MKHHRTMKKRHSRKISLSPPGLKKVNPATIVKCKNKKHGCSVKPFKRYTCYKRMKYVKNKNKPDDITLTNRKRGTRKLKKSIIKVIDWFDCSHFTD